VEEAKCWTLKARLPTVHLVEDLRKGDGSISRSTKLPSAGVPVGGASSLWTLCPRLALEHGWLWPDAQGSSTESPSSLDGFNYACRLREDVSDSRTHLVDSDEAHCVSECYNGAYQLPTRLAHRPPAMTSLCARWTTLSLASFACERDEQIAHMACHGTICTDSSEVRRGQSKYNWIKRCRMMPVLSVMAW
jgi:hypothetical protein